MNCMNSKLKSINYGEKFKWENFLSGKVEFLESSIWFQFYSKIHFLTYTVYHHVTVLLRRGCVVACELSIFLKKDMRHLLLSDPNFRVQLSIYWGYNVRLIFTAIEKCSKCGQKVQTSF